MQYTQFITRTEFNNNKAIQYINEYVRKARLNGMVIQAAKDFGAVGLPITGYCGDRDVFVGDYRNYSNPIEVVNGKCSNS